MNTSDRKKIEAFQGLRGYAIILIFISHCTFGTNSYGLSTTTWIGGLGVSLFIMLSGYLLAFKNNQNSSFLPTDTLKRRLKRFYPLHIVTLVVALPLSISLWTNGEIIKQIIKLILNVTLLHAWIPYSSVYFSYNAVTWYLSLTVFLVTVSAFSSKLFEKLNKKHLIILLFNCFAVEVLWCFFVKDSSIAHWLIYILPLVRYIDYFAGGYSANMCNINKRLCLFVSLSCFHYQ